MSLLKEIQNARIKNTANVLEMKMCEIKPRENKPIHSIPKQRPIFLSKCRFTRHNSKMRSIEPEQTANAFLFSVNENAFVCKDLEEHSVISFFFDSQVNRHTLYRFDMANDTIRV